MRQRIRRWFLASFLVTVFLAVASFWMLTWTNPGAELALRLGLPFVEQVPGNSRNAAISRVSDAQLVDAAVERQLVRKLDVAGKEGLQRVSGDGVGMRH